jgi:hypothetical protein
MSEKAFLKFGGEIILGSIILPWAAWATVSIFSNNAKADRVIAVEEKVDYIYKYLIEKDKK